MSALVEGEDAKRILGWACSRFDLTVERRKRLDLSGREFESIVLKAPSGRIAAFSDRHGSVRFPKGNGYSECECMMRLYRLVRGWDAYDLESGRVLADGRRLGTVPDVSSWAELELRLAAEGSAAILS